MYIHTIINSIYSIELRTCSLTERRHLPWSRPPEVVGGIERDGGRCAKGGTRLVVGVILARMCARVSAAREHDARDVRAVRALTILEHY